MAKKTRLVWIGGSATEDNYQCMKCGHRIPMPKTTDGKVAKPDRCPACKTKGK